MSSSDTERSVRGGIVETIKAKVTSVVGTDETPDRSRRDFLRKSGAAAGAAAVGLAASSGSASAAFGEECGWARDDDSHLPFSTGGPYGGWGGADYWGTAPGADQPPVIFVHGNGGTACNFNAIADELRGAGYKGDELWSIMFSEYTVNHDEMKVELDDFVQRVMAETGSDSVKIVSHSQGVTGVRYWMEEYDRFDWVDTSVMLAGPNHGVCVCPGCYDTTLGQDYDGVMGAGETCQFIALQCFSVPGHPLYEINLPDETPGDVDYYTFRGVYDPLYSCNIYSPYLDGAENDYIYDHHVGILDSATSEVESVLGGDATSSFWNWW